MTENQGREAGFHVSEHPIRKEAVADWIIDGVECWAQNPRAYRGTNALNGYCGFPAKPLKTEGYDGIVTYVPVHGGITYAEKWPEGFVYGFDTNHDRSEEHPREDPEWIKEQCTLMVAGLRKCAELEDAYLLAEGDNEKRAELAQQVYDVAPDGPAGGHSLGVMINILCGRPRGSESDFKLGSCEHEWSGRDGRCVVCGLRQSDEGTGIDRALNPIPESPVVTRNAMSPDGLWAMQEKPRVSDDAPDMGPIPGTEGIESDPPESLLPTTRKTFEGFDCPRCGDDCHGMRLAAEAISDGHARRADQLAQEVSRLRAVIQETVDGYASEAPRWLAPALKVLRNTHAVGKHQAQLPLHEPARSHAHQLGCS